MFSLLLAAIASILWIAIGMTTGIKTGTLVFFSIVIFIATYYIVGLLMRKRIGAVQTELQEMMMAGQQRMHRKVQQFQNKPGGNIKMIQRQIEADQNKLYQQALEFTDRLIPFKKWNLMMGRQIATMRMQFLYQLKEFDQVDALLDSSSIFKGPMLLEPMPVAMKMARQYKKKDIEGARKTFEWHIKWFRGSRGTLLYGLMTWILMKQGETEEARKLLQKGMETTGNETLAFNWERLSNNQPKSFSNAGLGEEWYGLYLENPPAPKQQRIRANPRSARPF